MSRFAVLAVALENEEIAKVGGEGTVTSDDLSDVSSVETQSADIAADMEANSGAESDIEQVEEFKEILEEAAANGTGVDATAAALATVATENLRNKLYITKSTKDMPSLESFGTTSSRVTATALAIESMGDAISGAWDRVVEFFKKIVAKIKEFLRTIFTASGRLEARVKKLSAVVNDRTAKYKMSEDSFTNKTLAEQFTSATKSKVDIETVKNFLNTAKELLVGSIDSVLIFSKNLDKQVITNSQELKDSQAFLGFLKALQMEIKSGGQFSTQKNSKVYASAEMLSGTAFILELESSENTTHGIKKSDEEKKLKGSKVIFSGIKKLTTGETREIDDEVPVLKKEEMQYILGEVSTIASKAIDLKKVQDGLDKLLKEIDKLAKGVRGTSATSSYARDFLYNGGKVANATVLNAGSIGIRTGNSALNYIDSSLRYYKKD